MNFSIKSKKALTDIKYAGFEWEIRRIVNASVNDRYELALWPGWLPKEQRPEFTTTYMHSLVTFLVSPEAVRYFPDELVDEVIEEAKQYSIDYYSKEYLLDD